MNKQFRKQAGFTLMEVAVVAAVSGTLAAMSVPMIQDYKSQKSVNAVQGAFVSSVKLARETAISQGQVVSICPSLDGRSCSSDWTAGWMVYTGSHSSDVPSEQVIHSTTFSGDIELDLFNENPQLVAQFQFDSNGFNLTANRITATFCDEQNQLSTLTIERSGRLIDSAQNQEFNDAFFDSLKETNGAVNNCTRA